MGTPLVAYQEPQTTETQTETAEEVEDVVVTGGVVYSPNRDEEDESLRDPFKSPFELEEERKKEQEQTATSAVVDRGETEPYEIDVLDLKGIYLDARSGYWAIFKIGDEYTWYQKDTKFTNGDLVNITDGAVIFKLINSDDTTQVRDLVKELDPGEE
jgi:Tfp pilus assembly protein PilP